MSNHRMPYRKHFCKDAQADPTYKGLPPYARAFLWDVIDAIHMNGVDGAITMTVPTLARYLGSTPEETLQSIAAIVEARTLDVFADTNCVTRRSVVSLLSRRMKREADERKAERAKKKRQRGGNVTDVSPECPAVVPSYIQIQSQSQIQIQSQNQTSNGKQIRPSSEPSASEQVAPKRKPSTLEVLGGRLADKLGSSKGICIQQVKALRQAGLDDCAIDNAIEHHGQASMKPWDWTARVTGAPPTVNGKPRIGAQEILRWGAEDDPVPERKAQ